MKKFSHPFMQLLVLALMALVLMVVAALVGVAVGAVGGRPSDSPSALLLWNSFSQLMMFALPVVLMVWLYYRGRQREYYRLDFGKESWWRSLAGSGVLLLLVPLIGWLAQWNDDWHWSGAWEPLEQRLRAVGSQSQEMVESLLKNGHPLLNLFGLALVPALCEELFFRAGIQNLLQRWLKNDHLAVWLAAALFSLAHGELFAFLPRFLMGGLLGYLYVYGRSLLVNVTAHFVNNALVVATYAVVAGTGSDFDPSAPFTPDPLLTVGCTLAAAVLFWLAFCRRRRQVRELP